MDRPAREHLKFSKANTKNEIREMRIYKDDTADGLCFSEINVGCTSTTPKMSLSDYFSSVSCSFDGEMRIPDIPLKMYGDLHFHEQFTNDVDLDLLCWQLLSSNQDSRALCVNILRMVTSLSLGNAFISEGRYHYAIDTTEQTSAEDSDALRFLARIAKIVIKNDVDKSDVVAAQQTLIYYYFGNSYQGIHLNWDSKSSQQSIHGYSTSEVCLDHYIRMKVDLFHGLRSKNLVYGGNYQLVYQALFYYYVITNGRFSSGFNVRKDSIKSYFVPNDDPSMCNVSPRKPSLSLMFIRAVLITILIKDYSPVKEIPKYLRQLEVENPLTNSCLITDNGLRSEVPMNAAAPSAPTPTELPVFSPPSS
ncbi:nonstructural protein P7-1 [Maize rough dwarf virus]|uniref:Probable non-structural 41.0 kDa protein n=2 Tax=Maize rough dwarf virus TaxID=10989 RepID=VP61_MRDV|nr:nonstructural protein P7-1 [Maize rough dwarf virus]P22119.1 RecName: Full=Probable non-structural 41.0 kDa protein [Maize rough dwarf virus]ANG56328.1 nonstructural protein P7-1 [Maize rough dwarf virus]QGN19632.1 nonstructural protein P7-1 [Maize rough dwarf virus]QGN19645.1 nonstructural protein P7-1 [Maize rough dwarf virus]QGN19658.1 nonstructural protein P7-1 [Maize rough dwarf virus]QGN19671.1 nonstructural protein P7-1 [Maize rough dwarf virus]